MYLFVVITESICAVLQSYEAPYMQYLVEYYVSSAIH